MGIWYTTREQVKTALGSNATAYDDSVIDDAIDAASRSVEAQCQRAHFYPLIATKYFDWPNYSRAPAWRLWLGEHTLISLAAITSGGAAIADYNLEPVNSGPPYDRLELDRSTSAAFSAGSTAQRNVALTGLWGYADDSAAAGTIAEALDASETGVDVSTGSVIGVGSVIKVDSERMVVTGRTLVDTTVNIGGNLTANLNNTTVPVASGAAFSAGEVLLVDSETMLILSIAGNNLIVKRAYDGSAVAAHTSGADIYAARTLTVTRGALGTTAATHSTSAAISVYRPPALIAALTLAETVVERLAGGAGWARTTGSGESERETGVRGLMKLRADVRRSPLTRKGRTWAV